MNTLTFGTPKDIEQLFCKFNSDIGIVITLPASHLTTGQLVSPSLTLTSMRVHSCAPGVLPTLCPDAVFVYMSTNKVYGDTPNRLPLVELEPRWKLTRSIPSPRTESTKPMTIDQSKHSLFGASKLAGDLLVQEYGRYSVLRPPVFARDV